MPRRPPPKLPALPEQIVADPADLAECVRHLAASPVIGFDTEFVGEDTFRPELCLVQVATPQRLYVLDPYGCGSLERFWTLLLDPARVVVVHAGREEVRMCRHFIGATPPTLFDIQIAAGLVGFGYPAGYAALVQDLLGYRMTKGETLTDWRRRPLTPGQLRYAFDDVRYLLPACRRLADKLKRLGRMDWAKEEFAAFVKRSAVDDPAVEKWRRVKGVGGFDRRALAVAREVFYWREGFAERVNRPARSVMRDDVLAEIAKRAPSRAEDLQAYRGLPRGEQDSILSAVRRANAIPVEDCPEPAERDNDPPQVALLGSMLGVVLSDLCTRHRLATSITATGQDLKGLVRAKLAGEAPPAESAISRGWRSRFVLPELQAVLDGTRALRIANPSALAPLEYFDVDHVAVDESAEGSFDDGMEQDETEAVE